MNSQADPSDMPPPTQGGLQAIDFCKSYKGRQVVKNMALQFDRRQSIGLLGPNGAGKTTSFYMITGLVRPDSGRILLDSSPVLINLRVN